MYSRKPAIPFDIQFEAACAAASVHEYYRVKEILQPYGYSSNPVNHKKSLKKYLTFTSAQLFEYIQQHPKMCEQLYIDSGDKRSSPNTFIAMENGKYIVGMYDNGYHDAQTFDSLTEAVTDYILFSLELPRLR